MSFSLSELFLLFLGLLIWVGIWILIGKVIKYKTLKSERELSVKKSKSVILWEVYEKVLPFLPNFPYKPRDMVFVGKWIDYIVFDGLSEWNLKNIIFLEVKSGASRLNQNEKMIQHNVLKKNIEYKEYRV